jgi:ABC-type transporter MlaC component
MHKLFSILSLVLLSASASYAQNSAIPTFNSMEERQAWIKENPNELRKIRQAGATKESETRSVTSDAAAKESSSHKQFTPEERETLIKEYDALILENKGNASFDHKTYGIRVEHLKAQREN